MRRNKNFLPLNNNEEKLIYALLRSRKKHEAAGSCGQSVSTMYRALADPRFMGMYRAARRAMFDEAMATLEKNADDSAIVLADLAADTEEESTVRLGAAKAVLANAFKARNSVGMEEEVAGLREIIEALEDALGNFTTTVLDSTGREAAPIDALGNCTSFIYDSRSMPMTISRRPSLTA